MKTLSIIERASLRLESLGVYKRNCHTTNFLEGKGVLVVRRFPCENLSIGAQLEPVFHTFEPTAPAKVVLEAFMCLG